MRAKLGEKAVLFQCFFQSPTKNDKILNTGRKKAAGIFLFRIACGELALRTANLNAQLGSAQTTEGAIPFFQLDTVSTTGRGRGQRRGEGGYAKDVLRLPATQRHNEGTS